MANILITGAGRGIALELAKQHAAAGDRVYATARDPGASAALRELAEGSGGKVTVHALDVGSDESVRAAVEEIDAPQIDVIYNVAGVLGSVKPELTLGSSDWDAWTGVINIMTYGPLRVLQGFLPRMVPGSRVLNLTSQLAASTWPFGGLYPYGVAKSGLNRLMRSVAIDLRDRGIIVGIVHPGYVQTDMGGPNAEITPEESASGLRKLAGSWPLEKSGDFLKWNGEPHAW